MLKLLITFLKELVVGQGSFWAKCTGLTCGFIDLVMNSHGLALFQFVGNLPKTFNHSCIALTFLSPFRDQHVSILVSYISNV